jgi:spore coat polysaccharide biosynthesis predicted glycosyltransferase SpsG
MRTLLLAASLKKYFNITYVTQNLKGNQNHLIEQNGFAHYHVKSMDCNELLQVVKILKPTLCIIDNYDIDISCEAKLKDICSLLVFDDEFKMHNANIVLNHSFIAKKNDYDYLKSTQILAGSTYTLLKKDFLSHKNRFIPFRTLKNKKILITLGGSDPLGLSQTIKKTLLHIEKSLHVSIVTTSANQRISHLKVADKELIINVNNMAKLMQEYDLIITSASTSLLETFALKKPFIAIQCASNQSKTVDVLRKQNLKNIITKFTLASLKNALNFVQYHPHKIKRVLNKYHFQKDKVAREIIHEYT